MTQKSILLVENNIDDRELFRLAFDENNTINKYQLIVLEDGEQALDYLFATGLFIDRDPEQTPNLIILDVNLPRMNGLEVLRRIRINSRTRLLPVVIMSASTEQRDKIDSYNYGCNSYVCKPVDFKELQSLVPQIILYWLVINQVPSSSGV